VEQGHATTPYAELTAACSTGACEHYQEMVRLRRNLHDGLGPGLAGIMLRADILAQLLTANRAAAEEMLRDLRHEAAAFMSEFRRVLADQSPAEMEGRGLGDALRVLAERMSRATGDTLTIRIDLDLGEQGDEHGVDHTVDRAAQVTAFWIAKEALTNVVKHAKARNCRIRVRVTDGDLRMSIVDDGVGGAGLARRGIGLTSMGSRAAELGGWCEVTDGRAPGVGVAVTAHLPAHDPDAGPRPTLR
jgi:signal transduction histidine kinase